MRAADALILQPVADVDARRAYLHAQLAVDAVPEFSLPVGPARGRALA